jgi:hypothetical protein
MYKILAIIFLSQVIAHAQQDAPPAIGSALDLAGFSEVFRNNFDSVSVRADKTWLGNPGSLSPRNTRSLARKMPLETVFPRKQGQGLPDRTWHQRTGVAGHPDAHGGQRRAGPLHAGSQGNTRLSGTASVSRSVYARLC